MSYNRDYPFLSLHIVEEILLNLDAQTLIKFSVVCRDWNSLITSPDFISRNTDRTFDSRKEVLLLKICRRKEDKSFETYSLHSDNDQFDLLRTVQIPPTDHLYRTKVVGTGNGLVCLADPRHHKFILWNPTVRRYVFLPRLLITYCHEKRYLGFGFDRRSNDFKVVSLVHYDDKLDTAWAFSYATWSWKHLTNSTPPPCCVHDIMSPVFINGVLHWIAWHTVGHYRFILTLDLAHEMFGEISLPSSVATGWFSSISLMATGDSLVVSLDPHLFQWSVWIMKQYGVHESWTDIVIPNSPKRVPRNVSAIRKNGDMILEFEHRLILRYNLTTLMRNIVLGVTGLGVIEEIRYHVESLHLLEKGDVNSY